MEQESQMIQGTVLAVIYQNPENGYCVLKVRTEQGEQVTVTIEGGDEEASRRAMEHRG